MKPKFKKVQEGVEIIDPIDRKRILIGTNTPVTPKPGDEDRIPYPMDTTVEIRTERIQLPSNGVYIREPDRSLLAEIQMGESGVLPRAEYILDLSGPLKIYTNVDSSVEIYSGVEKTEIVFGELTTVTISARSLHTCPAETITTTPDPIDVMEAVSMLGSGLKTTTTERSYPTLRGHPPSIKVSDQLRIPDKVDRPNTGVRIEVPPTLHHVFVVTPLAYYLAAKVVSGPTPQLVTDRGFSYPLENEVGFETEVERVLKQIFLLDCIVRTEGSTPLPLHERQAIDSSLTFNIEKVHGRPLTEQIESYLEVSFSTVKKQLPQWWLETELKPTANHIEFLPFVANDLATIKVNSETDRLAPSVLTENRASNESNQTGSICEIQRVETSENSRQGNSNSRSESIHQVWKHEYGSKVESTIPLSAFHNNIDQQPRDGPLEIVVICNERDMSDELVMVHSAYGGRNDLEFDVAIHHNLTTNDLREVIAQESDFIHYIGHIDSDGFRCSDGILDATNINKVGTKAFFLNACRSYEQGLGLIKAGSIGGIVTLTEVQNSDAINAGSVIARLLNYGLPLYGALDVLQKIGENKPGYRIIGDGSLAVSQVEIGSPMTSTVARNGNNNNDVAISSYISSKARHGGITIPHIEPANSYYLLTGEADFNSVTKSQLLNFFNTGRFPVILDGELRWSDDIKMSEL